MLYNEKQGMKISLRNVEIFNADLVRLL